ncbi:hypothetical protein A3742_02245 [Oleiphilus sp. HI0071]|uniref:glycosyltransferase n=2 Tax=Oleiphilus sp. HI0080 TaxID=1822255 RepID=UPI0007C35BB0|nr:glycosyltransferase [Oleiphilus sp. HI0080]KZY61021.1 hypothetical protein A3737_06035 [Oleiphilus sp. HI0065]KZY79692.1 hypothetical protein A3742_02245 [Oleiphilus sp. HI0071]KZY89765.1 hypothetical protein A3744_06335 [Oleiphilus sp. HI0073]KZZ55798.1 hypothetical protein A3760_00355 [Oleiphilus sp. HI0122]KZZ15190.1 hypothetical protein A3751_03700 [Oleiphilus sp. HI0080]
MQPLSILQVASGDLWGGAEAQVHTLCKYLARMSTSHVEVVLLNHGELEGRLRAEGIQVHVFDEAKLGSAEIFLRLRHLLKTLQPNIIHTHRQKENILASCANFLSIRAACIRTQHGAPEFDYSWAQWKNKIQVTVDQFCGRYLQKKIIAVSEELAHKLQVDYPKQHITVIENGVDLEALKDVKADAPFLLHEPKVKVKHVGIVGRLVPVKRVDIFLDMASELVNSESTDQVLKFHVIGDGPLRLQLEKRAEQLGLSDAVTFHGHIKNVASYIKSLDVLVMCSDHEGLPMTLLESMALGTPIVSHNAGAVTESFEQGEGGVLSEEHEASSYASALYKLLTSDSKVLPAKPNSALDNAQAIIALYREISL